MTGANNKELCLKLIHADTEEEVIEILEKAGYWNHDTAWRDFGDKENNWSTIGNQQSKADSALVEKIVNSIDAKLTSECYRTGISPESEGAPPSIRHAVAKFIEKASDPDKESAGRVSRWDDQTRTEIARGITVAATGLKSSPSITISDCGEGQTPERLPYTFLSIGASNKLKIPFVQGKFNMGGTGVLRFTGTRHFQLIVTRRDPEILKKFPSNKPNENHWSFTLVRRDNPRGQGRNSVFRYLAPVDCEEKPYKGMVLSFEAETMPIFPELNKAYARESTYGSLIKLYEYSATGFSASHIIWGKRCLLQRMDLLLPEPALPVRFHECRDYKGHKGSFDTNLTGLSVRLEDDKNDNIEEGFPLSSKFSVEGHQLSAKIFAFKKDKAESYKKDEGIIFVLNGQTHASISSNFFRSKKLRLGYIANSLLILVDCSNLSRMGREDLFMNSRERLNADSPLKKKIEAALRLMLKENPAIAELANRRREAQLHERLKDNKPLADTLESLIKKSQALSSLFITGERVKNPFKPKLVKAKEVAYEGEDYPTFFHFKGKKSGQIHKTSGPVNMRRRLQFETNAKDDYFDRLEDPGLFSLYWLNNGERVEIEDYVGPNLSKGTANLSFELPSEAQINDILEFECTVNDSVQLTPFVNKCQILVTPEQKAQGNPGQRKKPPSDEPGMEKEKESSLSLPNIEPVKKSEWDEYGFNEHTALSIEPVPGQDGMYDFYINEDNIHLLNELKYTKNQESLVKRQYTYGMVLIGLALINEYESNNSKEELESFNIQEYVRNVTSALSLFIIPMISTLGALDEETFGISEAA